MKLWIGVNFQMSKWRSGTNCSQIEHFFATLGKISKRVRSPDITALGSEKFTQFTWLKTAINFWHLRSSFYMMVLVDQKNDLT